ncbi:hypothetical protein [Streptomyces sp. NPDC087300]|uniref:hypothetical protein n=1 Tax=Streptomyces sp. NPDC087300 TaxID=3365780 RepID=UPI00380C9D02
MLRFSQGTSHTGADRFLGAAVGIGLKILGVDGVTLLEDEPDSAVRHGDHIAKVRVAPVQECADRVVRRTLDPAAQEQVFRPALVAELRERPYEFDIQVQLCTDLDHMPVEDLSVRWSETLSPFVTVAKLRLPRQDIGGDDNLEQMDATSMTPWRVTEEHRPLGNIMRARKEVYRQSSILRHQLNHQVRKEPSSLAEVFGR